jgi:sugar lactone lactonase YvrE
LKLSSSSSSNSSPHCQHLIATGGRGLSSVCFDGDRRLYATSSNDGTLYVEEDGRLLEVSTTGGVPSGLAIDHTNALHVLDFAHAAVLLVKDEIAAATSHHAHHNIGQVAPSASSSSNQHSPLVIVNEYEGKSLKGPNSAVFDSAGQLFFTDSGPLGETGLLERRGSVFVVTGEANNRILRPLAYESLAYPSGIALSGDESSVFVSEMSANRILRFSQRPAGVWHCSVFHQFSGRFGPTALCADPQRNVLYVARFELPEAAERGLISVINCRTGHLVRDIECPGPEVTGLALSPDGSFLVVCEATRNTLTKINL